VQLQAAYPVKSSHFHTKILVPIPYEMQISSLCAEAQVSPIPTCTGIVRTNFTNFTIKKNSGTWNFNVMELHVFQNELLTLGYKPAIPPRQ